MKKTIFAMLLTLAVAMLTSCQKETFEDDFAINRALDKELFDNVLTMTYEQLDAHAKKKHKVLTRIVARNPGIKVEMIYPSFITPPSANRGETDCKAQYNSMRNQCTISYLVNSAISVGFGVGVALLNPPSGVVIGAVGLTKETVNYSNCMKTTNSVYNNCIKP